MIPGAALHLAFKAWIAWEAVRRFGADKRNGTLELLLSTPLKTGEIVGGHLRFLLERSVWPVLTFASVDLAIVMSLDAGVGSSRGVLMLEGLAMIALFILDCLGLVWLGCWLSLVHWPPVRAFAGAMIRIVAAPAAAYLALYALVMGLNLGLDSVSLHGLLLTLWTAVGGGVTLYYWRQASHNLRTHFRNHAAPGAPAPVSAGC
jgi:ABC-type Na+ efflux pump permease subunit